MDDGVARALAEARALGFLGDGPLVAHERSAEAFAVALGPLPAGSEVLDLGSGGGVPGLLLAAQYPAVGFVLLDKHRRRTSFLARTVAELGWGERVTVVRADAVQAAHDPAFRGRFIAVVSRSFGPPAATAECAVGFLEVGGHLLVAEPPTPQPGRWSGDGLQALGLEPVLPSHPSIAAFVAVGPVSPELPRPWRTLERAPRW